MSSVNHDALRVGPLKALPDTRGPPICQNALRMTESPESLDVVDRRTIAERSLTLTAPNILKYSKRAVR